jgi:hypothetical protein
MLERLFLRVSIVKSPMTVLLDSIWLILFGFMVVRVCLQESRTERVNSWRDWKKGGKNSKGVFRPPKPKMEQRFWVFDSFKGNVRGTVYINASDWM